MDILIRPYAPGDLPECRLLWAELIQRHRDIYQDPRIGGEDPGQYFDRHLAHPSLAGVWIAQVDGRVAGLAGLLVYGKEADVEPVVVAENYRSKGIGRLLLARAAEEARRRGVRYLSVKPVARNAEAIRFFVENGFDKLGQIELFMDISGNPPREWKQGISLHDHNLEY